MKGWTIFFLSMALFDMGFLVWSFAQICAGHKEPMLCFPFACFGLGHATTTLLEADWKE